MGKDDSARRSIGIAVALLVHGLAVWLVLSGVGMTIVRDIARRPAVIILPPPEPDPSPARPPDPANRRATTAQPPVAPVVVPVPEEATTAHSDAPVITNHPDRPIDTPVAAGASTAIQSPPGPRGFGSITNRADCSAAFSQSFPREARRNGQQGAVTLQVRVSAAGVAEAAEVIAANPRRVFDRVALGVILSGACKFESDAAGYFAVLEIRYKLNGDSTD